MDYSEQIVRMAVDMANKNMVLMDGTTDPVKRIIAKNDIVFGVWQEPGRSVGMSIIKGQHRLREFLASDGAAVTMKVTAIPCENAEHAEAVRIVLGEKDWR